MIEIWNKVNMKKITSEKMERGTVENRIKPSCPIPYVSSKVQTRATDSPFDRFKPIHRRFSFSTKFFYLFISFFSVLPLPKSWIFTLDAGDSWSGTSETFVQNLTIRDQTKTTMKGFDHCLDSLFEACLSREVSVFLYARMTLRNMLISW